MRLGLLGSGGRAQSGTGGGGGLAERQSGDGTGTRIGKLLGTGATGGTGAETGPLSRRRGLWEGFLRIVASPLSIAESNVNV